MKIIRDLFPQKDHHFIWKLAIFLMTIWLRTTNLQPLMFTILLIIKLSLNVRLLYINNVFFCIKRQSSLKLLCPFWLFAYHFNSKLIEDEKFFYGQKYQWIDGTNKLHFFIPYSSFHVEWYMSVKTKQAIKHWFAIDNNDKNTNVTPYFIQSKIEQTQTHPYKCVKMKLKTFF